MGMIYIFHKTEKPCVNLLDMNVDSVQGHIFSIKKTIIQILGNASYSQRIKHEFPCWIMFFDI